MKTFLSLGCSLALLTGLLSAQTTAPSTDTPPTSTSDTGKHGHHPDFLSQLNLSDDQKAQIAQIKAGTDSRKEKHTAIAALLTPDQRTQWKTLRENWKAQHPTPSTN